MAFKTGYDPHRYVPKKGEYLGSRPRVSPGEWSASYQVRVGQNLKRALQRMGPGVIREELTKVARKHFGRKDLGNLPPATLKIKGER